jgi:D-tyrosyl-tRNA(Tyr) deacylase
MRAVVQRVNEGSVAIDGHVHARIGHGYVILLGIRKGDTVADARALADKCSRLRIFDDSDGRMNLSIQDTGGEALVVSQFTLYGDTRKGNRPGFSDAAPPADAEPLYEEFVRGLKTVLGDDRVGTGVFRAMMEVKIVNNGPVTLLVESA